MSNKIELRPITIRELHAQLQALIDAGHGAKPVVITDCRADYPFQAYTVNNQSGYIDKFMIYARPDARFQARKYDLREFNASPEQVAGWNDGADLIAERCGAFA
jgi:hypothetical protein